MNLSTLEGEVISQHTMLLISSICSLTAASFSLETEHCAVFVTEHSPLLTVALFSCCSVLGSMLVILGLYLVLWGKKEEAAAATSAKPVQETEVEQQEKV
jgi:hypothetical protein